VRAPKAGVLKGESTGTPLPSRFLEMPDVLEEMAGP